MNLFSKSNLSLMNKIVLAFVGYVFMILVMFSIIVVVIDRSHVKGISDGYSQNILADRTTIVEVWMEERIKDVEILALTSEIRSMEAETAIPLLEAAIDSHSDVYARYYIIDLEGRMTDTLGISEFVTESYDFSASSDKVIITEPIMDETFHQATIEVLVPVMEGNEVVGIIGGTILLSYLNDEASDSNVYEKGYTWVVTSQGIVVSHIDEDYVGSKMPEDQVGEAVYQDLYQAFEASEKGSYVFTNAQGEKEYAIYQKADLGTDWYVMVSLYNSDIYSTVGSMMTSIGLLFIVIMILSAVASWFLAKDITGPIQTLIDVTNKFTTGVKGIRAEIESKDEIGTLAHSFNNMADTIVAHTDNLEEMIKERTSVLADLNYQIISRNKELGTMNEELEKTNNTLHELASKDMLTGLQNRHEFQRELQKTIELVNAGREENFAVLFIDLDNFKYYNDTFSHEIGDFLLQEVSSILTGNVRGNDVVGRYGGDEFVIMLREGDYEVAKTIAQRIHKAILDRDGFKNDLRKRLNADVKIMGKNKLSSSIGIVKYLKSMNIDNAEDLLAKADETMYKAKKQGKSRVVVG